MALDDPLRTARRAVHAGHFRRAWDDLAAQPAQMRGSPEWLLLAAMARWRLGEFEPSRIAALQARDGYRVAGDTDGEMRADNVAAAGAFAVGDLEQAERGFSRALLLAGTLADDVTAAHCAVNLGNVAYHRSDGGTALSFYTLGAAAFERAAVWTGCANAWVNCAIVWLELFTELTDSLRAADRAITYAERAGSKRLLGAALRARAETLAYLGDRDLARAQVERGLELARREVDRLGEVEALRVRSVIHRLDDRRHEAERDGREAVELAEKLSHHWYIAEAQRELGELYLMAARAGDAQVAFTAAAEEFAKAGSERRAEDMRDRVRAAAR